MFELFAEKFGTPHEGTSASLVELALPPSADLETFGKEVGFGVFRGGLFSVVSTREKIPDLSGWERVLRANARLFASTAFGVFFFTTTGENVLVLETQYGSVVESNMGIGEVLNLYTDDAFRESELREPIFERFENQIAPTSVLCPCPAIALGGQWDIVQEMSLHEYLGFTAGLVMPLVVEDQRRIFREWQESQGKPKPPASE